MTKEELNQIAIIVKTSWRLTPDEMNQRFKKNRMRNLSRGSRTEKKKLDKKLDQGFKENGKKELIKDSRTKKKKFYEEY